MELRNIAAHACWDNAALHIQILVLALPQIVAGVHAFLHEQASPIAQIHILQIPSRASSNITVLQTNGHFTLLLQHRTTASMTAEN